mmetsp:Transcript_89308/g.261103  ORF Transcript_89308/g.261103 Transcript_89308/m.261103 type:complete len:533 (+) Transcript_89308:132-1730(+)
MLAMQALVLTVVILAALPGVAPGSLCGEAEECIADGDLEVERAEEQEAEALRTQLLQLEAQHFKGPHKARMTPAARLVGAVLDAQADVAITEGHRAEEPVAQAAMMEKGAIAAMTAAPAAAGEAAAAEGAAANATDKPWIHVPGAAVHGEHGPTVHVAGHGRDENYMVQASIPAGAFLLGGIVMLAGQRIAGLFSIYFGAQAGFSLYMKVVLSNAVVSKELHMKGVPAAFLVTAIQQVVAFVILAGVLLVLWLTPKEWLGMSEAYRPKQLRTAKEWTAMLVFSVAFALNIGLNNFSLSLLTVSMNLIIRSCLPLVTLMVQLLTGTAGKVKGVEVALMAAGVFFAGLATVAKGHGSHGGAAASHLVLGVVMCSFSDIAAALNLVLASVFGTHMKLNPLDTTFYMAVPCAASLLPVVFLLHHPVEWPGAGSETDWWVFLKVLELSPSTLSLIGLSGLFAAGYNLLQYALVQSLSATHAAFAGNFNKAATIMLSMVLGLESLPSGAWSVLMLFAIVGNILSFTGYSLIKADGGKH